MIFELVRTIMVYKHERDKLRNVAEQLYIMHKHQPFIDMKIDDNLTIQIKAIDYKSSVLIIFVTEPYRFLVEDFLVKTCSLSVTVNRYDFNVFKIVTEDEEPRKIVNIAVDLIAEYSKYVYT